MRVCNPWGCICTPANDCELQRTDILSREPTYTRAMRQALKASLLIAVMLWQTLVWVTPSAVEAQGEQLAHMAVHSQDTDHHHHADASLHLASDNDSSPHFHPDNGFQPLALTPWGAGTGIFLMPSVQPDSSISEPPSVYLDGLLRPPSLTS